jgi:hypothetical protein
VLVTQQRRGESGSDAEQDKALSGREFRSDGAVTQVLLSKLMWMRVIIQDAFSNKMKTKFVVFLLDSLILVFIAPPIMAALGLNLSWRLVIQYVS